MAERAGSGGDRERKGAGAAAAKAGQPQGRPGASPAADGARPGHAGLSIDKAMSWQPSGAVPPVGTDASAQPVSAADKTVSTVLGEIVWLLTQSPGHKALSLSDLEWMVMPPLLLRQFKLFYDTERAIPVGVVLFAKVSPAVAARLDAGGRLANLEDWRSGETVRVMTTVAPFGGEVRL